MKKTIQPGCLLRKTRRQDKGNVFTVTNMITTVLGYIYILKCYKTGKTKALRQSSLSEYRIVNK